MAESRGELETYIRFGHMKVPELNQYLHIRGMSVTAKGREQLLDLSCKAHDLGIDVVDDNQDPQADELTKLEVEEGSIPYPFSLKSDWRTDFSSLSNHTWGDM